MLLNVNNDKKPKFRHKKQKYFFFSLYSNVPDHVDMAGNFQTTSEYAKQFLPSAIFVTRKIRWEKLYG